MGPPASISGGLCTVAADNGARPGNTKRGVLFLGERFSGHPGRACIFGLFLGAQPGGKGKGPNPGLKVANGGRRRSLGVEVCLREEKTWSGC